MADGLVVGRGEPAINGVLDQNDLRKPFFEGLRTAIGGGVIHHQHLKSDSLRMAVNGFRAVNQDLTCIKADYDDG